MRVYHMIHVVDPEVGLLSYGPDGYRFTVRKRSEKYSTLQIGSRVTMQHSYSALAVERGIALITQFLQVKSLVVGTLSNVVGSLFAEEEIEREKKRILSFYPPPQGQEPDPKDLYVAIFF